MSEGRERELGDDGCFVNGNFDALVTCAPSIAVLRIEINLEINHTRHGEESMKSYKKPWQNSLV